MARRQRFSLKNLIRKASKDIYRRVLNVNIILRVIWTLTYLGSISLFIYYFHGIFVKWYKDPDISITIHNIPFHQIPFPATTFCTPYIISDELANFTDFQMRLYLKKDLPEYSQKEKEYLSSTLEVCAANMNKGIEILKSTKFDVIKSINKSRQYAETLTGVCGIESFVYDCIKMFNIIPTVYGLCYSFNMQGYNTIFNKGILHSDFDYYKRKNIVKSLYKSSPLYNETVDDDNEMVHWTLQDGYLSNDVNSIPYRSSKLFISLYLGFKNLNFFDCYTNYFKVMLHLPNEVPIVAKNMLNVNISAKTTVIVEAHSVRHNLNMRKYSPQIRQCFFDGEKQLKFFKSYTKAHCDLECLTNYTLRKCGCARFFMPRTSMTRVCNLSDLICASHAYHDVNLYQTKIDKHAVSCNCLPPCNEIKYTVKSSVSDEVPSNNPVIKIMTDHNISDCSILEIFASNTDVEEHEYYVAYNLQNFVADVGGLLGLFMGYSFLSIAQMIQKCIKYVYKNARNDGKFEISHVTAVNPV